MKNNQVTRKSEKQSRGNFFSCLINSSPWQNFRFSNWEQTVPNSVFALYNEDTDTLEVYAMNEQHSSIKKIIFQVSNVSGAGEYVLSDTNKALVFAEDNWCDSSGSIDAKINITELNESSRIIEGFFCFEISCSSNHKVQVKDGVFHLKY
jgi:hypothetical protein